jgi:hypothetical protein
MNLKQLSTEENHEKATYLDGPRSNTGWRHDDGLTRAGADEYCLHAPFVGFEPILASGEEGL